ncbi:hypothetical protein CH063_15970 [Colletotrichum higginsianum]|uniref:Uncharacterized protein n=1 Tax=Colletotrichum higginsianum (strain IMI 349063) TaxID=759273 RepID=H1W5B1_COLHI|nr:hypothetical protein CH063_15970 [Colletotrichum higginsianum]
MPTFQLACLRRQGACHPLAPFPCDPLRPSALFLFFFFFFNFDLPPRAPSPWSGRASRSASRTNFFAWSSPNSCLST